MPINRLPFDLTPEERESLQLLQAELDLHPERLQAFLAELLLLRQVRAWAMERSHYFPPALRAKILTLGNRSILRRAIADSRAELEPNHG
jgi:hypothetical protein